MHQADDIYIESGESQSLPLPITFMDSKAMQPTLEMDERWSELWYRR